MPGTGSRGEHEDLAPLEIKGGSGGLSFCLSFLSYLYGMIISVRNRCYDLGIFKIHHVTPLVVSVGNIEVGGTGKTPCTIALASALQTRGHTVAIVTRGYKGRLKGPVQVRHDHTAAEVGDEPKLMAYRTGLPVIKSPDRVAGALFAHRELGIDTVVLDDAYQHRRIHRDYNICLVSGDPAGETLLPLGRLREPPTALQRADCIIATKAYAGAERCARLEVEGIVDRYGRPAPQPATGDILAFCGIARPEPFFETLRSQGARVETIRFRDHHAYTSRDIARIKRCAAHKSLIITTEKDLVRLNPEDLDDRWHALRVRMDIPALDTIIEEIEARGHSRRISR